MPQLLVLVMNAQTCTPCSPKVLISTTNSFNHSGDFLSMTATSTVSI